MIGKLARLGAFLFVYFCVATVLAALAGFVYLWRSGMLSREKAVKILAVAYEVPLEPSPGDSGKSKEESMMPRDSLASVKRLWEQRERNLELRDQSLDSRLDEYRLLKKDIEERKAHYDKLFDGFQKELEKLKAEAQNAGRAKARKMLENLPPDAAKSHLLALIKSGEKGLADAVALVADMPVDNSKKIMSRFNLNDPQEGEAFNQIMNMMREGEPTASLVDATRDKLLPAGTKTAP